MAEQKGEEEEPDPDAKSPGGRYPAPAPANGALASDTFEPDEVYARGRELMELDRLSREEANTPHELYLHKPPPAKPSPAQAPRPPTTPSSQTKQIIANNISQQIRI